MTFAKSGFRGTRSAVVTVAVLSFCLSIAPEVAAQTPPSKPVPPAAGDSPKPVLDTFKLPSVSVRPPDKGRMRTDATALLGWRLGVRTDAFGPVTFFDGAAKADAAGLAAVEGVNTQQVSQAIPKKLDYNLTSEEIAKVQDRLDELRLKMPAYSVDSLPADAESRRKIFEFARALGADTVILPAEPASFSDIDNLASETGMNVAIRTSNPQAAASALEGLSSHIGLSVDLAAWEKAGISPVNGLEQLKGRLLAADLHQVTTSGQFLAELSRLQPPAIQPIWPPTRDGGAERSPGKPLFLALDPASGGLSQAADAYDKAVLPALAYRIDTLAHMQTISSPDALPADVRAKIDAAIPRQALVKPARPRKLLVMDLCVDGGYYHAIIPNANLALQLIGKYTGAYIPTFSNNLDDLKYPNIKQYDAVFLNNVEGELFIDPEVLHGLMRFVREGGGLAGLHATSFASSDIPEFGDLIGAQTGAHKYNGEPGTLRVEDPNSPLTKQFGTEDFNLFDEFYHFLPAGPYSRQKLHILLSLDPSRTESSANRYTTRPDNDYGMVWIKSYGKGRVFFCALGHKPEFYENPKMEQLLSTATQFVLGDLQADTTPSAMLSAKK